MGYIEKLIDILNDKELSKEQKEKLKQIFPELQESEDERIRKAIYNCVEWFGFDSRFFKCASQKDCLAWIEKQGKQDNNEDSNILQRFSFYSYKDEPNILYLSSLYVNDECRNKGIGTKILEVADEVAKSLNCHVIRLKTKKDSDAERLYRTHGYNSLTTEDSDEIWLEKQCETFDKIVERARTEKQKVLVTESDGVANIDWDTRSLQDAKFLMEYGLNYINKKIEKQSEQKFVDKIKPKFNVGDIVKHKNNPHLTYILKRFTDYGDYEFHAIVKDDNEGCTCFSAVEHQDEWELVEQKNTWKPSGEQMKFLWKYAEQNNYDGSILTSLYNDLKKLREE